MEHQTPPRRGAAGISGIPDIYDATPIFAKPRRDFGDPDFKRVKIRPRVRRLTALASEETICRFIDLPKLFHLLQTKKLMLTPLAVLRDGDPFECCARLPLPSGRDALMGRITELAQYAPLPGKRSLPTQADMENLRQQLAQFDDSQLADALHYVEQQSMFDRVACSCWHRGALESDAMWKVYAGQLGVMLKSTVHRLETALMEVSVMQLYAAQTELCLGSVEYQNLAPNDPSERPWMIKREAFGHERELRLFVQWPYELHGGSVEIGVNVAALISEIVITPFGTSWQRNAIERAIRDLLATYKLDVPVSLSKHRSAPKTHWPFTANIGGLLLSEYLREAAAEPSDDVGLPTE
jgi:hypothetical protein